MMSSPPRGENLHLRLLFWENFKIWEHPCWHYCICFQCYLFWLLFAFSALMLLVGQQEEHLPHIKLKWWGAGMVMERGADDLRMVQLMPLPPHPPSSLLQKFQNGLSFWYWPNQIALEKRPWNDYSCVYSGYYIFNLVTQLTQVNRAYGV